NQSLFRRRGRESLEHELLDPSPVFDFRRVEVALRIGGHVVKDVELSGRDSRSSERVEGLERFPVVHPDSCRAPAGDIQERCAGSAEKAVLATVSPLPQNRLDPRGASHHRSTNVCVTNLPSIVNTCTRLPLRSETYTSPSFDTLTPSTMLNCRGPGYLGSNSLAGIRVKSCRPPPRCPAAPVSPRCPAWPVAGSSVGTLPNAPHIRL